MTRITKIVLGAVAALVMMGSVNAGVSLNAARIGGENVVALADFYESAFGLHEVNRLEFPGMLEIMLNFGNTPEDAKANSNAQVVIMHRESDDLVDPVPHLIFTVTDMTATVAAVKAAGGTMNGEPRPFGNSGMVLGFGSDPAGNGFELIQLPRP